MATKLKIIEAVADIVPAPTVPDFEPAFTRKRHADSILRAQPIRGTGKHESRAQLVQKTSERLARVRVRAR